MANSVLSLSHVSKSFGDLSILKDISFELSKGEAIAILGPSGEGKSTLLHISGLMEKPSTGSVLINGQECQIMSEPDRASQRRNTIGFLFQFHHLLPDFNVLENVLIPARLADDSVTQAESEARDFLERLGLSERLTHKPHQLSGGEQQRVALARALIRKPDILLCDEPTGNLDHKTAEDVMDLILNEIKERELASIIVTHNETLAKRASSIRRLKDGGLN